MSLVLAPVAQGSVDVPGYEARAVSRSDGDVRVSVAELSAAESEAVYGVALILVNFALSAGLISVTARISLGLMMGAILFGYLIRLGLVFAAVLLVRDASWISLPALGATIIVTHLGLLAWELKYLAISLAYPGLKPDRH